jgi:hypothetical protein
MSRDGSALAPGSRRSRLRDDGADFDNKQGFWTTQQLVAMDAAFVAAVKRHHGAASDSDGQ